MESSEDDAGAATNASRRESARERDVGRSEDGNPNGGMVQEAVEAGTASETASMSEEAFDADSVPSPSAQDVNTSTEAILDMIDEIVDGPDAIKRRSRASEEPETSDVCAPTADEPSVDQQPSSDSNPQTCSQQSSTSTTSAKSDIVSLDKVSDKPVVCISQNPTLSGDVCTGDVSQETINNTQTECTSAAPVVDACAENPMSENLNKSLIVSASEGIAVEDEVVTKQGTVEDLSDLDVKSSKTCDQSSKSELSSEVLPQSASKFNVSNESAAPETFSQSTSEVARESHPTESPQASSSVTGNEAAESTSEEAPCIPLNIPSSSVAETESQNVLDSSENRSSERTIKCVTSSDSRDSVTVGSAESTSSDNSVSEGRTSVGEAATRSPLRRRLVRPAPSDRRPDSTVSSTVDSQTANVHTTEQSTSESVAKDVSSSSDAVSSVCGNVKPEEIRNLSEISVCKAETSMNPPKKIKLIRQKPTASVAQRDITPEKLVSTLEREQCQSTSSDSTPSALSDTTSSNVSVNVENVVSNLNEQCSSNDSTVHTLEILNKDSENKVQDSEIVSHDTHDIPQPTAPKEVPVVSASEDQKRVSPIKLNLIIPQEASISESKFHSQEQESAGCSNTDVQDASDLSKQVPKLTIKLGNKQTEELKSPIPKLTIRPIRPPSENEKSKRDSSEQIPCITKLNIKPIAKPADKINDIHRKSSSSEISESESSENDESNSTSDQASNSDQCTSDIVPKVTIKVGKPGTESEGKFYTEQNAPKLLIKGIQSSENEERESPSKLKLVISQTEDKQTEKVPKLTIKTVAKTEGQPLSPKLTIKPLKPPDNFKKDVSSELADTHQIPKQKVLADSYSSTVEVKENTHVPKITIKTVVQTGTESSSKTLKKASVVCDSPEHIPVVTKLNIKPILKPVVDETESMEERVPVVSKLNIKPILKPIESDETLENLEGQVPIVSKLIIKPILKPAEIGEKSENIQDTVPVVSKLNIKPILKPPESSKASEGPEDKVPVVSKLNIKPIIKPKDNEVESSLEDIPKITKLNIKPLKNPEAKSSEEKDCDELNADTEKNSIPVVTKINIKPIVKPIEEDTSKDSENQSSETGNSSDDNNDHIPVVTKINIKPILKPIDADESTKPNSSNEENIPVVTKLNIKPLVKPEDSKSPSSPKRDSIKITKLNIKPVLKPEEIEMQKSRCENEEISVKNPPLLMKINFKSMTDVTSNENLSFDAERKTNNLNDGSEHSMPNNVEENIPRVSKLNIKPIVKPSNMENVPGISMDTALVNCKPSSSPSLLTDLPKQNCVPGSQDDISFDKRIDKSKSLTEGKSDTELIPKQSSSPSTLDNKVLANSVTGKNYMSDNIKHEDATSKSLEAVVNQTSSKSHTSLQNCTLLKKLLESKKDGLDKRLEESRVNINHTLSSRAELQSSKEVLSCQSIEKVNSEIQDLSKESCLNKINDVSSSEVSKPVSVEDIYKDPSDSITKPLQISVSDRITQSPGPDSPRIILKINKTDHGASAKIITEERPGTPQQNDTFENSLEIVNDKQNQKKVVNSRKKAPSDTPNVNMGKRLRSSRIVEITEKSPPSKRNVGKRPSSTETSPVQSKDPELSVLETKRLKLGQLLSNKTLGNTPLPNKAAQLSPTKPHIDTRPTGKMVNHSLLNNENCSKNGNSKLHNILSNLQAKQAQALALTEVNCSEKVSITTELDSNASTGSLEIVEVVPAENSHPTVQEMIINENSESHDFPVASDEMSQDPLEVDANTTLPKASEVIESPIPPPPVMTPQPKKRGRPRKLPVSEGAKPATVVLPVPALEERPQRSLRLSRDQSRVTPTILVKPRGRGRGRGAKRAEPVPPPEEPTVDTANKFFAEEQKPAEDIDPTSSRIKLPRMTEALDKLPTACTTTPLSSRRRNSSTSDVKLFDPEPKVVLNMLPKMEDVFLKSPEVTPGRGGRGGRGSRGGRGRTPGRSPRAGRGRGRGGGRGAMYMKETMGIYGRVCGPATTTVQLFEEETCMMDDNATPAKPSHLLDEDSQSSVMSSTNDSSKMRKSKFADLFDSNKVWTAADVKEYMWPPPEQPDVEHQVMMIQEQVAMFLGVKSFKRRYPELKRRTIGGEERDYVLNRGLVTEALCDLGITAVDASEVLDIMLSDYPHKYEEYRAHQRQRQLAEATATAEETTAEVKTEPRVDRVEMKPEPKPVETKPEPPKIDLEKSRQEAMAAAIASASEWNARLNLSRAGACADLQTHTVQRRRPPPARAPATHVCPPAGFYPHALLPGQYQHTYRVYTPEQLRYFPLSTVTAAPGVPPSPAASESDSEPDWGSTSSSDDSVPDRPAAKRKKLTKTKRSSGAEASKAEEPREDVDTCRVCKLRLEANRKHTHERFLVCANCNAKLHPGCVELSADTIRKVREYAWQCADCKTCCTCLTPGDDDKMLFCDLCDRGFHIYCVGLDKVPSGRWHCVECAICKSCGAREPHGPAGAGPSSSAGDEARWHHQTRRGPGGHKVYSHSLCTPCARAYRIGRYCPLCERSFIGPKGTMQLVICKLCDRQHHQDCVRQTVQQLKVLDYTCGECRRGGITSRAAAVRLAPRTIATLFMAKRRFNKYAHRQYMASRQQGQVKGSLASDHSNDVADETGESCEPVAAADDVSDASECGGEAADAAEASDPLEGAGDVPPDETAAAVAALRMDFGD